MEKYEEVKVMGATKYTTMLKCMVGVSGEYVAIKKYGDTEKESVTRKLAIREVRQMRILRHVNIVRLLEVFRKQNRFFLVYEYINCTLLERMNYAKLSAKSVRGFALQIARAISFIHDQQIMHRNLKPDNIMVTDLDIIKLAGFSIAKYDVKHLEPHTDFVAANWYRPPELLLGDKSYNKSVDIWSYGCIVMEMETNEPLLPGENRIDQLSLITRLCGALTEEQRNLLNEIVYNPASYETICKTEPFYTLVYTLNCKYHYSDPKVIILVDYCLKMDSKARPSAYDIIAHTYFTEDHFVTKYLPEIHSKNAQERKYRSLLKKFIYRRTASKDLSEGLKKIINFNPEAKTEPIKEEIKDVQQNIDEQKLCIHLKPYRKKVMTVIKKEAISEEDIDSVIVHHHLDDDGVDYLFETESIRHILTEPRGLLDRKDKILSFEDKMKVHFKRKMIPLSNPTHKLSLKDDKKINECFFKVFGKPSFEDICLPDLPGTKEKIVKRKKIKSGQIPDDQVDCGAAGEEKNSEENIRRYIYDALNSCDKFKFLPKETE